MDKVCHPVVSSFQWDTVRTMDDPTGRALTFPPRRALKRHEIPGHGRYLTCSCYDRLPLFGNARIKDAFVEQLALTVERLSVELFAWVVMPEHFHLLLRPPLPQVTVTRVLAALKRPFAARVLERWRELNTSILARVRDKDGHEHFWQRGGGYDRNIFTEDELAEKIEYIHRNPVRRGLAERKVGWRWSSAAWYELGLRTGPRIAPIRR
jgi:putative transposase